MPVVALEALIECDGCGVQFRAECDTARRFEVEPGRVPWSLHDEAVDAVRGGHCRMVGKGRWLMGDLGVCGVRGDPPHQKLLCPDCLPEVDGGMGDGGEA